MPHWILLLFLFAGLWAVLNRRGSCGWHGGYQPRSLREREPGPGLPTTPEQSLQRRFVEGSLTVEEYERELDRLLRKH